ncbi:MAG TPA: hypothetical protein PLS77_09705 [Anaerolineaceae bacterium]|nr:hypothetical protein [Anaerolineaceae bacterium]HOD45722.1 hypothetical protein [Anaerolineaceae bacterium]HOH20667.1 hypothetical protein [Anaerolineaceae bacterium]HOU43616.1 hypothetical protein [Anaerolineaceae bacterium]HPA34183.1 hypothetical protein [Anaerolineaceae bacterium]
MIIAAAPNNKAEVNVQARPVSKKTAIPDPATIPHTKPRNQPLPGRIFQNIASKIARKAIVNTPINNVVQPKMNKGIKNSKN